VTANTSLLPEFSVPTRGLLELAVGRLVRKPSEDQQFRLSIIIAIATARCAHLQDDSIVVLLLLRLVVLFVFWGDCVASVWKGLSQGFLSTSWHMRRTRSCLSRLQTNEHTLLRQSDTLLDSHFVRGSKTSACGNHSELENRLTERRTTEDWLCT
jgi:hypothetical protein